MNMMRMSLVFEITEVALVLCNIVNNDSQQDLRIFCKFVTNKLFGQLLDISPKNFISLKNFNSGFLPIKVWFTHQNSKPQRQKIK